ncbi:atp3 gamma subunit of the F1 sector of mitochondrial F1F0 ATP synthase [Spiromyces aspiralis]|uniref:Atp3 gamma subunit of the F1 sector of mitochondrial F1F0 ATP synthase n=1 Tax=Spiromyces aspiralis TaxID=68401 RepID=A0ACC1HUR3_9FUNG|nr:atp3 gamma subunit of the F1 sector of mitochondrial F1F0 ATP synthase [Spiromyces aspiralis]
MNIQARLKSVTNISKITASMKMIASTKTTRAQRAMETARIYGLSSNEFLKQTGVAEPEAPRELLIAASSDKGLCGGIHSSISRFCRKYINEHPETSLVVIGDKVKAQLQRTFSDKIRTNFNQIGSRIPTFEESSAIASTILKDTSLEFDTAKIVYNKFISVIAYEAVTITAPGSAEQIANSPNFNSYEVDAEILENLNEFIFGNQIHWALVEGHASEMAAKRTAMENATKNSEEMIQKLTLSYNRGRQAVITNELRRLTWLLPSLIHPLRRA